MRNDFFSRATILAHIRRFRRRDAVRVRARPLGLVGRPSRSNGRDARI